MPVMLDKKRSECVAKYEVELDFIFHLKNLYKGLFQAIEDEGYKSVDPGQPENLYFEIINPEGMVNHYIWWRYQKKYHDYFQNFLKIDWQGIMTGKAETMHNDKKRKTNKSDMTIRVEMWVMWDPEKKIADHWFLKHFERYLRRKIYNKTYLWIEQEAKGDAEVVRSYIKRYFGVKADEPAQKLHLFENRGMGDH